MYTRSLTRAQTLLLPYSPFAPDPGDLLEGLDLYLAWGRMAGSAVTEWQKHCRAVELWFYCCHTENRGLAPLPVRAVALHGSGTGSSFSQGSPLRCCLSHVLKEQHPLLAV